MSGCSQLADVAQAELQLQRSGVDEAGAPQGCVCLEAASPCALAVASLRACNAVIAAFPAVGHGDGPENEVGSVNIELNDANELHKRLSCRDRV